MNKKLILIAFLCVLLTSCAPSLVSKKVSDYDVEIYDIAPQLHCCPIVVKKTDMVYVECEKETGIIPEDTNICDILKPRLVEKGIQLSNSPDEAKYAIYITTSLDFNKEYTPPKEDGALLGALHGISVGRQSGGSTTGYGLAGAIVGSMLESIFTKISKKEEVVGKIILSPEKQENGLVTKMNGSLFFIKIRAKNIDIQTAVKEFYNQAVPLLLRAFVIDEKTN